MEFGHSPAKPLVKAHGTIPHDAMIPSSLHVNCTCLSVNHASLIPASLNKVITFNTNMNNQIQPL